MKKTLADIFDEEDELGLLNIKPKSTPPRNEDERLVASFEEINDFFEKNKRAPAQGGGIQEHQLYARLKSLREHAERAEILRGSDRFGLLETAQKKIETLEDILSDADCGLFEDGTEGLFDFKHIKKPEERAAAEFVAKRKPCKDFEQYASVFKGVQSDLKNGKRQLIDFKLGNLREGAFYVHNGVLFYLEEINITRKEHYREDGTRVREDGRTRCIFENGTESNMLKRSVEKILYANGKAVSENTDSVAEILVENFNNITTEDKEAGYIYILKSKSENAAIKSLENLYKIGFSTTTVAERIKKARKETTYLMADVGVVATYKCYNMNPQKFEQLIHSFFGKVCLNVDVFDENGKRYTPREWFIAPLGVIDEAIALMVSGEIVKYAYSADEEAIYER